MDLAAKLLESSMDAWPKSARQALPESVTRILSFALVRQVYGKMHEDPLLSNLHE
jgi:hypothetical protein